MVRTESATIRPEGECYQTDWFWISPAVWTWTLRVVASPSARPPSPLVDSLEQRVSASYLRNVLASPGEDGT